MTKQIFSIILAGMLLIACSDKMETTEGGNPCDEIINSLYVEKDGLLIIELESGDLPEGWEIRTNVNNYLGTSYIEWQGNDFMSKPGPGIIQLKVKIDNPGTYRVQLRNYIAEGTSNTDHNDVWLRMADADDYFGDKNGHLVYPKGSGKSPNPNGASVEGWFKIYNNTRDKWSWGSKTSDNDAHNIFAKFNEPGIFTVELSGRSSGFALDRLTLYKADGIPGDDDTLTASGISCQ